MMLGAAFPLVAQGALGPSLKEGVYSTAQAAQGRELYRAQCAECHGPALEGASGAAARWERLPRQLERAPALNAGCRGG
jgi:mono/diheme cytochrome c family protein